MKTRILVGMFVCLLISGISSTQAQAQAKPEASVDHVFMQLREALGATMDTINKQDDLTSKEAKVAVNKYRQLTIACLLASLESFKKMGVEIADAPPKSKHLTLMLFYMDKVGDDLALMVDTGKESYLRGAHLYWAKAYQEYLLAR